jgi:hypothetical protein
MESRVRPGEHALSRLDIQELTLDEHLEYRAAERFGQGRDIVQRQPDEGTIGPEAAVGDQHMEVGMPVGERAVGLDG